MNELHKLLPTLQDMHVRNLAWILSAPQIIDTPYTSDIHIRPSCAAWLMHLDKQPKALHRSINHSKRLGNYYESLWRFYFEQSEDYQLIASRLQVTEKQQTRGEFDFLLLDNISSRVVHLEVAIKFYLYYEEGTQETDSTVGLNNWLGPNSRDTLQKKLDHLIHKQIQLSETTAARALLEKLGIENVDKQICLQGYLFKQTMTMTSEQESDLPPACCWFYADRFHAEEGQYLHLQKPDWLTPVHSRTENILDQKELQESIRELQRPQLFAKVRSDEQQCLLEETRFFIVPPYWPRPRTDQGLEYAAS